MGAGPGSLTPAATAIAADLYKVGIPVVSAPRPVTGAAPPDIKRGPV